MNDQRAILIAGPTASGKSGLALCLAEQLGGVVINADSMQVYRDLRILTARPTAAEEARAPHRLYGFVDGSEAYSAGRFVIDAATAFEEARSLGLRPIVVGGTGLYFKALLDGLSPIPPVDDGIRLHYRALAAGAHGTSRIYRELQDKDPVMAQRLGPNDRQRVARALEVLAATGRSLAHWQSEPGRPLLKTEDTVRLWLAFDRQELYRQAEHRFDAMLEAGALDEVRALLARQLGATLPVMRAVGVPELAGHLRGELELEGAAGAAKRATRNYIKRQLTWHRRHMISWKTINKKQYERISNGDVILIESVP